MQLQAKVSIFRIREDPDSPSRSNEVHEFQNHTISCTQEGCSSFQLFFLKINEPGDYYYTLEFGYGSQPLNESPFEYIEFEGKTLNRQYIVLAMIVRAVLFLAAIANFILFYCNLKQMQFSSLCFEQRFIFVLNALLIMFFDPIAILQVLFPTKFLYILLTQARLESLLAVAAHGRAPALLDRDVQEDTQ